MKNIYFLFITLLPLINFAQQDYSTPEISKKELLISDGYKIVSSSNLENTSEIVLYIKDSLLRKINIKRGRQLEKIIKERFYKSIKKSDSIFIAYDLWDHPTTIKYTGNEIILYERKLSTSGYSLPKIEKIETFNIYGWLTLFEKISSDENQEVRNKKSSQYFRDSQNRVTKIVTRESWPNSRLYEPTEEIIRAIYNNDSITITSENGTIRGVFTQ